MARLPRLAVAGQVHLVVQRGHNRQPVFIDDHDRSTFLAMMLEAARGHALAVHAYVLLDNEVWWLVTPPAADTLSRTMQVLGRRYVGAFNRRHGRSGTLWEGRFRATVVDSEAHFIDSVVHLETQPVRHGMVTFAVDWPWSSAMHHVGRRRDMLLADHRALWVLGNTPFEREMAHRRRLEAGLPSSLHRALDEAALKGWALGSPAFLAALGQQIERPLARRSRGRPRKQAIADPVR